MHNLPPLTASLNKQPLLNGLAKLVLPLLLGLSLGSWDAIAAAKVKKMPGWFSQPKCQKLEIYQYQSISDNKVLRSSSIDDPDFIHRLMGLIEAIPSQGDELISFAGHVEFIELVFDCNSEQQKVEIYEKKFKTPSTGFNSNAKAVEAEAYQVIDALLRPDYNKAIPKVRNLEIRLPAFSLTYLGTEASPSAEDATTTAHTNTERYRLKKRNGSEEILEVTSGQTPPSPLEFKSSWIFIPFLKSSYTLYTYESPDHVRLFPHSWLVQR